nr:deoxyribose-phosphate aldolase [candidate division Zixibacteria bacterium]
MIDNLNKYFDHSLLTSETDHHAIIKLCREAVENDFYGIAINPCWVTQAHRELSGAPVKIISVAGFPLSANTTAIKIAEAVRAVEDGADEIDMVANIGWMVSGEYDKVEDEISQVRKHLPKECLLKVIIETPKITPTIRDTAVEAIVNAGADYAKTATGFFGGATTDDVAGLYKAASGRIKVKASGGIRTLGDTLAMIEAGAQRIGSSASVNIMNEYLAIRSRH